MHSSTKRLLGGGSLGNAVLLEGAHKLGLLLRSLEAAVAELGRGVDELEVDLLLGAARGLGKERLAESDDALAGAGDAALDHQELVLDDTVLDEATHGGDVLGGKIVLGGSGVGGLARSVQSSRTNLVDLLVELSAVVHAVLTGTRNGPADTGRVPSSNASHAAEASVRLAGQAGDAETGDNAGETATLGDTAGVDHLVVVEHLVVVDLLLEQTGGEVDLLCDVASVDLDLHHVGLAAVDVLDVAGLSVGDNTNDLAVLLDALNLLLGVLALALGGVGNVDLGKGLLLGVSPVLVHAALELVAQVVAPNGGEGTKTAGGLDVADDTDNDHGGRLDDGDGLHHLLLVGTRAGAINLAHDVGHTGLVTHKGGQVRSLLLVIAGKVLDFALAARGALAGRETQRTVTRPFVLAVRHYTKKPGCVACKLPEN